MNPQDAFQTIKRTVVRSRTASLLVMVLVSLWSISELINLSRNHTIGAEKYGVLVAAIAVGAGAISVVLLASTRLLFESTRVRALATVLALAVWAFVAIGGMGGTVAHIVGPDPDHGPVDPRPRPIAAPLVFAVLGLVGGIALYVGQRRDLAAIQDSTVMEVTRWLRQQ